MVDILTAGAIANVKRPDWDDQPINLQISGLSLVKEKYHASLSDGSERMPCILTTQVGKRVAAGEIGDDDVLKLTDYTCNSVGGVHRLIVSGCDTAVKAPAQERPETSAAADIKQDMQLDQPSITTPASTTAVKPEPTSPAPAAVKREPTSDAPTGPALLAVKQEGSAESPAPAEKPEQAAQPLPPPTKRVAELTKEEAGGKAEGAATPPHPKRQKENAPPAAFQTPAHALIKPGHPSPGPTPSPSEERRLLRTAEPGSARKPPLQPINALNPYNNNWSIKARVERKGPRRSFSKGGSDTALFSVELVDEQGTQIEATFWREAADAHYDSLEDGKVYVFSRGKVKPANRAYSTVRNDYTINFDEGCAVEECAEQDPSKMQARLSFVPIDQLHNYIGKKVSVDLCAVVTAVGPLGSVKRKSDASELFRRDVTLLDQSLKTVSLTLWGETAEEQGAALEAEDCPILVISNCRVTDFNGVSVSGLQRSAVRINPEDVAEAVALRQWYEAHGRSAESSAAGEGLATARKGSGSRERATLASIQKGPGEVPGPEEKPEWFSLAATVAAIRPDQTLYYMANPENNRKVTEVGDGTYFCEYDSSTVHNMERRYVLSLQAVDHTGECYLNLFNDQAVQLLGLKADEVAPLKEGGDDARYQAVLKSAQWTTWLMRIQAKSREYNGEVKQRFSVQSLAPLSYSAECKTLLESIARYGPVPAA